MSGLWFAVFPGGYLLCSRLQGWLAIASWFLINPLVIGAVSWWVSALSFGWFLVAFILAFIAWQSVYEIGYLENDIRTVRRESKPTKRLNESTHSILEQRYKTVVAIKWGIAVVALAGIAALDAVAEVTVDVVPFALFILATRIVFRLHNTFRNRVNIATYFGLSALKYIAMPMAFAVGVSAAVLVVVMILLFPAIRTLEHSCKAKYGFRKLASWISDFDAFRPVYYFALSIVLGGCALYWRDPILDVGMCVAVYFLLIRLAAFVVSRRVVRDKPAAYQWERSE